MEIEFTSIRNYFLYSIARKSLLPQFPPPKKFPAGKNPWHYLNWNSNNHCELQGKKNTPDQMGEKSD